MNVLSLLVLLLASLVFGGLWYLLARASAGVFATAFVSLLCTLLILRFFGVL
jgi:hypothetical protein